MTTVKVKAHMRNGKKVKGYSYTRGTVKAKRKMTKAEVRSARERKKGPMANLGKMTHSDRAAHMKMLRKALHNRKEK